MRLDKDKIRESLSKEDINRILFDLGSGDPNEDKNGNLIYQTVCHNTSHGSHKLYYYKNSHNFQCYTNCGHISDIYDLVIKAKETQGVEYSFPDALKYVAEITGKRIVSDKQEKSSNKIDDWDWIKKITRKKPKPKAELPAYNENVLDVFMPYLEFWSDEGITREVADKYEIGYYFKENQIILVNRDEDGRLIGIRSRNLDKEKVDSGLKYLPTTVGGKIYSFPSMFNVYGLNHTKDNIRRLKKCLIFEGEKSVLKAEQMYGNNNFTVAVLGSNISSWHRDKILSLGVEEVFIAFDKHSEKATDKQITIYKQRLLRLARKFTPYVRTFIIYDDFNLIDYDSAPIDHGKEIFEELMRKKYEIATYETEME